MRTRQSVGVTVILATTAVAITGTAGAQSAVAKPAPDRPGIQALPGAEPAPSIACRTPATLTVVGGDSVCTASVARLDAMQRVTLWFHVTNLGPGPRRPFVRFTATHGTLSPDSARVGSDGVASTVWFRSGGADTVGVGASVVTEWGTASRLVRLTPAAASPKKYKLVVSTGRVQHGYEKAQLRYPLVVEVLRADTAEAIITDVPTCSPLRVIFRRVGAGGAVTPDTSLAAVGKFRGLPDDRDGCFARANWTLGEGPGIQDARAAFVVSTGTSASGEPVAFRAIARSTPKLTAGYAAVWDFRYRARVAGRRRVQEVEHPQGDTTLTYPDTVVLGRDSLAVRGNAWRAAPIFGLSFAPIPARRWATAFIGVDAATPGTSWFVGLSALRTLRYARWMPETEGLMFDIHVLANVRRLEVIRDEVGCASSAAACDTKDPYQLRGVGAAVVVDAGSLLSDVFKKLVGS